MRIMLTILILVASFMSSCTPAPYTRETSGRLYSNQYTPVTTIGSDRFLIQGYNTEDALDGAKVYCNKQGKKFNAESIVPHTQRERATVTFTCR